jgi:glutamine synthetase adenylyltransferase
MRHGKEHPSVRKENTREGIDALAKAGLISAEDCARLQDAQRTLRGLVEALRVVTGNATDVTTPPYGSDSFAFLARRLSFGNDIGRLRDVIRSVSATVQEVNGRLLS